VRGLWSKQPPIHLIAAEAARNQKNPTDEARHLAFHIQELVFQDNSVDAKRLLHRIADLVHSIWLPNKIYFEYRHSTALYRMKLSDFDNAQHICEEILGMANKISDRSICAWSRRWLAECLYKKGQISDAQQMLQRSLEDSIQYGYQRSIIFCQIHLAAIEMDRGEYAEAEKRLIESSIKAQDYQDRRYIALTQELFARLHTLRGDLPAARAALDEAIDLFERLGMRRDLAEAREELARLDERTAAPA